MQYRNKTALVTGASAGIGAAYARGLASRGCDLVLVARRAGRLEEIAGELRQTHGVKTYVVPADLSAPGSAAQVRAATDSLGLNVSVLVNNAGFGSYGPYETIAAQLDHDQVMVNVANLVAMTHAFLPPMVERGDGAVLNISSIAAFQPIPYMAVYGASKAFILSFSEALWHENRKRGVKVIGVCPGATDTEFFDVVGNDDEVVFGRKVPPSAVVDQSLRALERGRCSVVIGASNKVSTKAPRFVPRALAARISGNVTRPRHAVDNPAGAPSAAAV